MGSKITYEERTGANACDMYYAYDNGGKLYGFYYDGASSDGFYYYKRNLQGDIIGILNSTGTEVTTYLYDAWGKLVSKTGSLASTVGSDNPFRYRGYYYDDETGLYYLNQRYYNPRWRRFINADNFMGVTGVLLSHNLFGYCYNNPVNMIDSSGQTATVMEWVQQTSWLAAIWGVAFAEPTPIGEIVAVVVTVAAYVIVQTTVNNQTTTAANAQATTTASTQAASNTYTKTISQIDWGAGDKNHILKGSRGRHIEGWKKLGIDPNKGGGWGKILPILKITVDQGTKAYTKVVDNGYVHYYIKYFKKEGIEVVVKIWENIEGTIKQISDAWPKY